MGVVEISRQEGNGMEWSDWRQGDCLLPNLLGKFYDQQQHCDVTFQLQDGSTVQAHKLLLAVASPVFEGMFFGPLADKGLREVRVEELRPAGFRRLLHFVYNSRCLSWKIEEPEEWWGVLEAAHKYLNTRLVEQVERRLRDLAKKEANKGIILRHLNMANRMSGLAGGVKSVFMNAVVKSTSQLLASEEWLDLDMTTVLQVLDQEFLAATEGELYLAAKKWSLANTSTEQEALKLFLEKFVQKITPEYMSQRDFLTCVANDSFLAQVDVFRDWTIKVMVKNAADHTIRGSYRPMRVLNFYFNAVQKGTGPLHFREETATIEFQQEVTRYTASVTGVWDTGSAGLHLSLRTESQVKTAAPSKPLSLVRAGPKSTKASPSLPEMVSDEEVQKTARKSALIVARMKDGSFRAEVILNLDDQGGFTSKQLLANTKSDVEFVQVMVMVDARPNLKVSSISHKQFVEHVGAKHVADREAIEGVAQARSFSFEAESTSVEQAEKEICRALRLKDCQAWYVAEDGLCHKRDVLESDPGQLSGYMRYNAVHKMLERLMGDITASRGRALYTGKGGDQTDQFLKELAGLASMYRAPNFWIMLEKEFKDDPDKLVSSVCKFDSATGSLSYCGTICLQMTEEAVLRPTEEFFAMILYNSDPKSKVFLRRFLNPQCVTPVKPGEDVTGIHNFDIFIIQETEKSEESPSSDYDDYIMRKVNEVLVIFRPKSGAEDRVLQVTLDATQGVSHLRAKLCEAMDTSSLESVTVYECISSEGATANPLKRRSFRRPMELPVVNEDPRKVGELFAHCEDGTRTLYYNI